MGQQQSPAIQSARKRQTHQTIPKVAMETRIEHEGILKLKKIPFKNSIEIDGGQSPLFLENAEISLSDLLESRLYTNRLFPQQDVEKLIQNVVFTLAYLESNNIIYKDICPQNIYYELGSFKILPNQLIQKTSYEIAYRQTKKNRGVQQDSVQYNGSFVLLSPQMIIALRCNEQQIVDGDILQKSNVFIFGMVLLEATTLLPSYECYDMDNYDILDNVINQRLSLVQEHYSEKITRIIANMIDYDYEERMNLKDLSIWINRQLNEGKQSRITVNGLEKKQSTLKLNTQKQQGILTKSRMVNSQVNKASRTNQVYLNRQQCYDSNGSKEYTYLYSQQKQNNKVYLKDPCKMESENWKKEKEPTIRKQFRYEQRQMYRNNGCKQENRYDDHRKYVQDPETRLRPNENQTAKHRINYKYYPSAQNIQQSYPNLSRFKQLQPEQHQPRDYKQRKVRQKQQVKQTDHSLLRIKQQIEKSRKLIQQFQKNEGIVGHSQYQY